MAGVMAFIYDENGVFPRNVNEESVVYQRLQSSYWEEELKALVDEHYTKTGSPMAEKLLAHWEMERGHFWQVCPKEMINKLAHPLSDEEALATA